ncbi:MAG: hypothetical protein QOE76_3240 [Frankiales bacterium]|nr:hypothetical protein [Frankiales bacterium]
MTSTSPLVDPRGQRFGAAITSVVLVVVLLTSAWWLLAAQALVFALGAIDLGRQPYGIVFRRFVRPRLAPPVELEAAAPPQFAQLVGLLFAVVGLVGYLGGVPVLGAVATGLALAAAALNAVFAFCLGCELHLLLVRAFPKFSATP